ncbi:hypothetical protein [Massilia pseudoviolaceinigra]|uniref:hypothetical protein n=1 Tax=Massilia pseudoviolaceinigra TaxID=3057165 RepID=UPI0027963D8F|nr:hypothetical protein [Massilia sp. CCM 9206]MDQ1920456.1 hypothetical protein [Massilia sp. CCM 9206]
MKKTSLRKNRFKAKPRSRHEDDGEPKGWDMHWYAHIINQMYQADVLHGESALATISRPISPGAQAFYDKMSAIVEARHRKGGEATPVK